MTKWMTRRNISAFVEDNTTMSSVQYFEYDVSFFMQNQGSKPYLIQFLYGIISVSIALKYISYKGDGNTLRKGEDAGEQHFLN